MGERCSFSYKNNLEIGLSDDLEGIENTIFFSSEDANILKKLLHAVIKTS